MVNRTNSAQNKEKMMEPSIEKELPKLDLAKIEEFESNRSGYFADEYRKSSLYWSSLCDLMRENDGSTQHVLEYIAGKLETDRIYTSAIYANADKVFGDKKGTAKLRHDKIRHAEQKAKQSGKSAPVSDDTQLAGGGGRDAKDKPATKAVAAIWEMAEMDCRAARHRDTLCDDLEHEELLGTVKVMGREMSRRFKELSDEGNNCLVSLASIDKRVGQAFLHLKETLGDQLGGKTLHEDVWFLDCSYRTAVVHQKEAWNAVTARLKEVFNKMKDLEGERRKTLRDFMIKANVAIGDSWSKLRTLCGPAMDSANAIDSSRGAVDREVSSFATMGAEVKKREESKAHELVNTTNVVYAEPAPSDTSFIDGLTAPLDSPLVRSMMMIERRHGKTIGSTYNPGLMVLSWDGFIHFFDLPSAAKIKQDASPSAAFQEISPTISLDDLLSNKKDLEDVLMFRSTHTLQLDDSSTVEAVSSHKGQHKLEVKGKTQITSIKRHFGSGTTGKTITFRTATEAEMNHALDEITDSIYLRGGMQTVVMSRLNSGGSKSSQGSSINSESGSTKVPADESESAAPSPAPAPSSTVGSPADATPTDDPAATAVPATASTEVPAAPDAGADAPAPAAATTEDSSAEPAKNPFAPASQDTKPADAAEWAPAPAADAPAGEGSSESLAATHPVEKPE